VEVELGVVAEVFALPRPELEVDWWYSFALCAERVGPMAAVGGFTIEAPHGLRTLAAADTIVIPGTADVHGDPTDAVLATLRRAHARGARLVSICSGAFVLAATGLLDGLSAATHWRYAPLLASRFPRVRVDATVL
jgi:AraC family transcriptional activator FtrA